MLSAPQRDTFLVGVNETLNRTTAADLADAFVRAAAVKVGRSANFRLALDSAGEGQITRREG